MGAFRDAQYFELDDARNYGVNRGRADQLASLGSDLGIDPDVVDGLGLERNLVKRIERLEAIAFSVGKLLQDSKDKLDVLKLGDASEVADFLIADQLAALDGESRYMYFKSLDVYRLEICGEDVNILTNVSGGAMMGPYSFGERAPLNAGWIQERLSSLGADVDEEFSEQVVSELTSQILSQGEHDG